MKIQFLKTNEIIELEKVTFDYFNHTNNAGWEDYFYENGKLYEYFAGPYDVEIPVEIDKSKYKII